MSYHTLSGFFNTLAPLGESKSKKKKKRKKKNVIFEEGGAHLILDEKGTLEVFYM